MKVSVDIDDGIDPFTSMKRNFIVVGHRARSDGKIALKDLCGASGRWDGIARCITSALFTSHAMRRDSAIHVILLGPDDSPKILSVLGSSVRYLNPDERASSALMRKNLAIQISDETGVTMRTSPGIFITRGGLDTVLNRIDGTLYHLHEDGIDLTSVEGYIADIENRYNFILSDDMDMSEQEESAIADARCNMLSVGPLSLHSNQAIIIVHNWLDRLFHEQ